MRILRSPGTFIAVLCGAALMGASLAEAQSRERHYPLDHQQPGMAARWSLLTKPDLPGSVQPVRVIVPEGGTVTFFSGAPQNEVSLPAPAQVGMAPGNLYRIRITDLPGFPGAELYPTIELIDRLHPPEGLADQFPVPIEITTEEIELALHDRMVTKVIYLEQPDRAPPTAQPAGLRTETLSLKTNLLEAADHRGRPIAILRIGGRIPDVNAAVDEFYSRSPLVISRHDSSAALQVGR